MFAGLQRAVRATLTEHSPVPEVGSRGVTASTHGRTSGTDAGHLLAHCPVRRRPGAFIG